MAIPLLGAGARAAGAAASRIGLKKGATKAAAGGATAKAGIDTANEVKEQVSDKFENADCERDGLGVKCDIETDHGTVEATFDVKR
ncbi:hypothetical protein NP511_17945 [Natrinema thermotolerans]|uniref:Uncharacterized protein n=1 Tax=Natrinema thermotolerans TaxID=121872 RepID=A0AAF0PEL6_9EURY|nr:hypothetical protein [Natrinema thermotolerans]WMT07258.1 hypothetical protein NP511_17945 [Natrinema thermotolerans]